MDPALRNIPRLHPGPLSDGKPLLIRYAGSLESSGGVHYDHAEHPIRCAPQRLVVFHHQNKVLHLAKKKTVWITRKVLVGLATRVIGYLYTTIEPAIFCDTNAIER